LRFRSLSYCGIPGRQAQLSICTPGLYNVIKIYPKPRRRLTLSKPRVIIFNGLSLDGRMDFGSDAVDMGLYYDLASRWNADAMLSGSGTMLAAEGSGPVNESDAYTPPAEYHPLAVKRLVVADSRGRIRSWNSLRSQPFWREVTVLCSRATPHEYLEYLEHRNVPYIIAGTEQVDFAAALDELNTRYGVQSVRVDSGGILNGVLLRAGLVDEVSVLIDPCLVGGTSPRAWFVAPDLSSAEGITRLRLLHFEQVKENVVWLKYEVVRTPPS
jgi:2,5-diamino-6-(ribosylamino)-4(3H)-pyrimidinone 5'-phosphate reductase